MVLLAAAVVVLEAREATLASAVMDLPTPSPGQAPQEQAVVAAVRQVQADRAVVVPPLVRPVQLTQDRGAAAVEDLRAVWLAQAVPVSLS